MSSGILTAEVKSNAETMPGVELHNQSRVRAVPQVPGMAERTVFDLRLRALGNRVPGTLHRLCKRVATLTALTPHQ